MESRLQTYGKTPVPALYFLNSYAAKKIGLHSAKWLLLFAFIHAAAPGPVHAVRPAAEIAVFENKYLFKTEQFIVDIFSFSTINE